MQQYNSGRPYGGQYPGQTAAVTPRIPNPSTGSGTDTRSRFQSQQPPGGELYHGNYAVQGRPSPMRTVPGSEYSLIPATPSSAAPPPQPKPPLSAIGSVAGHNIVLAPPIQGPAVPSPVMVGPVFS